METLAYEHVPGVYALVHESTDRAEIVHVFGDLDLVSAPEFESHMVKSVRIGKGLIVNLLGCKYIDSTALAALVRAQKVVGSRLRVVITQGSNVDRVFKITAMKQYFPVSYQLEHAMLDNVHLAQSGGSAAS